MTSGLNREVIVGELEILAPWVAFAEPPGASVSGATRSKILAKSRGSGGDASPESL